MKENHALQNAWETDLSIAEQYCRDLAKMSTADFRPAEAFFELTRRLEQQYAISKGALILFDGDQLKAVSTWRSGMGTDGLIINLPEDSSLFRKVVEDGRTYSENFTSLFSGNFFEKKLLIDQDTRAFVLQPLKSEGKVIGLLGYSSESPDAFAMFEEGTLDAAADGLAAQLARYSFKK